MGCVMSWRFEALGGRKPEPGIGAWISSKIGPDVVVVGEKEKIVQEVFAINYTLPRQVCLA